MRILTNPFANNRLLNDIFGNNMTLEEKRESDIKLFLKYMETPRTESEVRKYLDMLLKSECCRNEEKYYNDIEPNNIFVNTVKKVVVLTWNDGTSTRAKCSEEDEFDLSVGYSICLAKRICRLTNTSYKELRKEYIPALAKISNKKSVNGASKEKEVKPHKEANKTTPKNEPKKRPVRKSTKAQETKK